MVKVKEGESFREFYEGLSVAEQDKLATKMGRAISNARFSQVIRDGYGQGPNVWRLGAPSKTKVELDGDDVVDFEPYLQEGRVVVDIRQAFDFLYYLRKGGLGEFEDLGEIQGAVNDDLDEDE